MDPAACQAAAKHFDLMFAARVCEATYATLPALQQQLLPETVVPHSVRVVRSGLNKALVCVRRGVSPQHGPQIVVAVRGTSEVANWLQNIDVSLAQPLFQVPRSPNAPVGWSPQHIGLSSVAEDEPDCRVHRGFRGAVLSLFDAGLTAVLAATLKGFPRATQNPLLITGHSMGGAMGTLITLDFVRAGYTIDLVTFGAPMVGNTALSKVLDRAANPSTPFLRVAGVDSDAKARADGGVSKLGSNHPRLWTFGGRTRGLLCCLRVVNSMDIVPMSMTPLKPYVHYPPKALVLDEFWEAVVS